MTLGGTIIPGEAEVARAAAAAQPREAVGEIRPFPIPSLLKQVEAAVAAIPEGKTMASVIFADEQRAGAAAMVRLGGGWSFFGFVDKPWKGKISYGAAVEWAR